MEWYKAEKYELDEDNRIVQIGSGDWFHLDAQAILHRILDDKRLVQGLRDRTQREPERILDFCHEYGLLGILPQSCIRVSLPPRWIVNGKVAFAGQDEYLKLGPNWHHVSGYISSESTTVYEPNIPSNPLITDPDILQKFERAQVQVLSPVSRGDTPKSFGIGEYWRRFIGPRMPSFATDYIPEQPNTEAFFNTYAESIFDWEEALIFLRTGASALALAHKATSTNKPIGAGPASALIRLNNLSHTVSTELVIGRDGDLQLEQRAPSPWALLALEIIQKVHTGPFLIKCENEKCGAVVLRERKNTRYCSDKCKFSTQKRRARNKEKLNDE